MELAKKCDRILNIIDGRIKFNNDFSKYQFLIHRVNKNKSKITKVFLQFL